MKYLLSLLFTLPLIAFTQINVTNNSNATTLAQTLAGANITVTNATLTGDNSQSGTFTNPGTALATSSGVILSTGRAVDSEGPNNEDGSTGSFGGPGDAALTNLSGNQTSDAVELKFDFEVQSDVIEFSYIFASEEYNEFVNEGVNDVFAFFISGPGITGEENLAIVPGTTTPVSIDDINNNSFWQFYNDNDNGMLTNDTQFDGFTTIMEAKKSGLTPCSVYTLRLVIADGGDDAYDSGVFLQENSLVQGNVTAINNTPNADDTALEGCVQASFTFSIDQVQTFDTQIDFDILGTAVNSVDYAQIDNYLIIPAGQTEATIFIDAFSDGLTEGQETIELQYAPTPCATKQSIFLYIDDSDPIDFTITETDLTCNGDFSGEIDATITGGFAPFDVTITPDGGQPTNYSSTTLPITGLSAGIYNVQVDDIYGCTGDAQVVGNSYTGGPDFLPDGNGSIISSVLPIAGLSQGTLQSPDELQSICLNMEHSSLGDISMRLVAPDGTVLVLKERFNQADGGTSDLGEPVAKSKSDGGNSDTTPGIGYDYCFTATPTYGTMVDESKNYSHTYTDQLGKTLTDNYLPSGSYTPYESFTNLIGVPLNGNWTIEVEDHTPSSNGYIFEWSISFKIDGTGSGAAGTVVLTEPDPIDISLNGTITQAACNGSDGEIDIDVVGNFPNFSFAWDDAGSSTTEDISGLPAGNYTVVVTDQQMCSNSATFNVSNATGPTIAATVVDENCDGDDDGSISTTLTTSGSIVSTTWDSGQTVKDISALSPGDYTITVTDNSGCVSVETFTIDDADPIYITGLVTNESCGDQEGEIDITVIGGDGNYSFSWSNGSSDEDLTDLNQNTYTVTVTDGNNCQAQETFTVINTVGNCTPICDLAINNVTVVDELCGQGNGSITLSIYTSNTPHTVVWDNGMTGDAISGLSAGTYTATITDVETCEIIETYTISNDAGTLAISNPVLANEVCGAANGSIDVTVTGGDGNYTFSWSNSAATEDLTNLVAGTYTLLVTDGTGCSTSTTLSITNETGSMALTFEGVVDETCGNNQGSIDINVSPTNGNYSYDWNSGAYASQDLTNLSAGMYTCVITDINTGCQITKTYTVNNNAGTLAVTITDTDNEVCGNAQGEIDLTISGGTPNYTILWNNSAATEDLTGLTAGTYSATITDQSGCSATTGDIILQNEPGTLSVQAFITDEVCGNGLGEVDLVISGGTPNYTTNWNTGQTTEDISGLSTGNYTYTVDDQNGCQVVSTANVANSAGTLTINNITVTDETCGDATGAIDITVSGGDGNFNFNWSNSATSEDLTGLSAGNYTITLTDNSGCEVVESRTLIGDAPMVASETITHEICGNGDGSISVDIIGGSPNYTYTWSSGGNTNSITGLNAGNYSCDVEDQAGCIVTLNKTINSTDGNFSITNDNVQNNCNGTGGSIDLTVVGGLGNYIYNWDNGSSTEDLSGLTAGNYSVTISSNSCQITESYTISDGSFTIDENSITLDECGQGIGAIDATLNGSGNYDILWSNGEITEDISNLTPGDYTITVTDLTEVCTASKTFTVGNINNTTLSLESTIIINDNCEKGNGSISLTVSGSGNYEFLWSNGETTQDILNLTARDYTVAITDLTEMCTIYETIKVENEYNNCKINMCLTTSTKLSQGTLFDSEGENGGYSSGEFCTLLIESICAENITLKFNDFDLDFNDYFAIFDGNGPTANVIDFYGNFNPPTQDITSSGNSLYIEFFSDPFSTGGDFEIEWNSNISSFITDVDIVNDRCEENTGEINISVLPSKNYEYDWNNGSQTKDIMDLGKGDYTVIVTDPSTSCLSTETFTVTNEDENCIETPTITSIYPNPSNGLYTIEVTSLELELQLYNLIGELVDYKLIQLEDYKYEMNITEKADATYIIRVNEEVFKIIKNE